MMLLTPIPVRWLWGSLKMYNKNRPGKYEKKVIKKSPASLSLAQEMKITFWPKKCRWRVCAVCVHTNFCGLIIPPWSNWQHSSPSIGVYDTVYWENLCVGGDQDTTQGKVCKSCWGPKSVESSRSYLRGWLCKFITLSMEFRRLPGFAVLRFYEISIV